MAEHNTDQLSAYVVWIVRLLVASVFAVAAVGKAADPIAFAAVVRHVLDGFSLRFIPSSGPALSMILLEGGLAAVFALGLDGRRCRAFVTALLVLFSAVLLWMWRNPSPFGCGCMGLFSDPQHPTKEVVVGLLRNGGLLVCLAALSGRSGDEGTRTPGASPTTSADQTTDNPSAGIATHAQGLRAFTLVEVLVCVLIVLALFSLLFPALRNSRDEARAVRDLAQTRSIFIATQAYAADHQDVLPSFAPAGRLRGPKPLLGQEVEVAYFTGQARMYINLLVPTYCSDVSGLSADTPESNVGIGLPPNAIRSSVQMTYTAFAQPAYFVGQQAPADAAPLLRAARLGQVAHPSAKGLLLDLRPAERAQLRDPERKHTVQPWGIAWADGSATQRTVDLLLGYRTVTRPAAMFDWPVLATEGGVAGRDFELAGSALP